MTTKQIDYVIELSDTLNFSRAAENLFVSQPSLTYQIQLLESEIGFKIFERSVKSVSITPAGKFFCSNLRKIKNDIKNTVEQGRNISSRYSDSLNVCLPMRSCLYFLPQIMRKFKENMPSVALNLRFIYDESRIDLFLRWEQDILFAREAEVKRFSNVETTSLFQSHFYIVTQKDDPLTKLETITNEDLKGRTFMIGGGSPPEMIAVQNRIINNSALNTINCSDRETALANVAAGNGIVLSPGFANDHNGEFAWIPFDCQETIPCVLAHHKSDNRECTKYFIELTKVAYSHSGTIAF